MLGVWNIDGLEGANYTVAMPNLGTINFGILSLHLEGTKQKCVSKPLGLNSWDQFDVLKPYDAYTLSSVTEMKTLNANVTFFVNVTVDGLAHAGDSLYEQVGKV